MSDAVDKTAPSSTPAESRPVDDQDSGDAATIGSTLVDVDRNAWRTTVFVALGLAVFSALWILFLGQRTYDFLYGNGLNPQWTEAYDIWSPVFAATTMLSGGWLQPYTVNYEFVAMPGYAFINLPLAAIVQWLELEKLVAGVRVGDAVIPISQTGPVAETRSPFALVYGVWAVLWSLLFLKTVRALAWELGVRRRLWTLQVAALVLGFVPMVLVFGHLEDALMLSLVLLAVVQCRRHDWMNVAICLTFALSLKQSAFLVVPMFFFFVPKGTRVRFCLVAGSLPLLLLVGVFLADFDSAYRALVTPPTFPTANVARQAWFIATDEASITAGGYRTVALLLTLALSVWLRRNRDIALLVAGIGVAFLARIPVEAVTFPYYLAPALVVAAIYERHRNGRMWFAVYFGLASLGMFWWSVSKAWWFWPVEAALLVLATWSMWIDVARRRPAVADDTGSEAQAPAAECAIR